MRPALVEVGGGGGWAAGSPSSGTEGSRFNPPTEHQESPLYVFLPGSSLLPPAESQCGREAFSGPGRREVSPRRFGRGGAGVCAPGRPPPSLQAQGHFLSYPQPPPCPPLWELCSCPHGPGRRPDRRGGRRTLKPGILGRGGGTRRPPGPPRRPKGVRRLLRAPLPEDVRALGGLGRQRVLPFPGVGPAGPARPGAAGGGPGSLRSACGRVSPPAPALPPSPTRLAAPPR